MIAFCASTDLCRVALLYKADLDLYLILFASRRHTAESGTRFSEQVISEKRELKGHTCACAHTHARVQAQKLNEKKKTRTELLFTLRVPLLAHSESRSLVSEKGRFRLHGQGYGNGCGKRRESRNKWCTIPCARTRVRQPNRIRTRLFFYRTM